MKRILFLIAFLFVVLGTQAQRGSVITVDADTLNGAETVNFEIASFKAAHNLLTINAVCANIGGTSDGTLTLYGSLDNSSWVFINGVGAGVLTASPQASITGADLNQITITDALIASWTVKDLPYIYYRIAGVGTSGDSTLISPTYIYK
jgi:hypothetical protein